LVRNCRRVSRITHRNPNVPLAGMIQRRRRRTFDAIAPAERGTAIDYSRPAGRLLSPAN
jgi:hypothetical protein